MGTEVAKMAEIKEWLSRIRFVYRRTSNMTKIMLIVAILVCMGTLITLRLSTKPGYKWKLNAILMNMVKQF